MLGCIGKYRGPALRDKNNDDAMSNKKDIKSQSRMDDEGPVDPQRNHCQGLECSRLHDSNSHWLQSEQLIRRDRRWYRGLPKSTSTAAITGESNAEYSPQEEE